MRYNLSGTTEKGVPTMIELLATKCPWCDGLGYTDSDDSPYGTIRCPDCGGTGMQAVERMWDARELEAL